MFTYLISGQVFVESCLYLYIESFKTLLNKRRFSTSNNWSFTNRK